MAKALLMPAPKVLTFEQLTSVIHVILQDLLNEIVATPVFVALIDNI